MTEILFARKTDVPPLDASYLLLSVNGVLTSERVLTAGTNVTFVDTGPGGTLTINASGGGGGAPTDADYLVVTANAGLSAERVVLNSTSIQTIVGVGGQVTWERSALTGDATAAQNVNALTLATVNANVGTFGSATQTAQVTVNAKGLTTAAANVTITPAASNITGAGDLTKTDDTNVTLTLGGTPTGALLKATSITVGWTGTLAAGRLNSNVVQAVTNDTNVTGSIAVQNLTLGWTGTLALARLAQGTDGQLIVGQTSASPLYKTITGDWTMAASGAATIANNAVTYAKMQDVTATSRVIGRKTAGAGDPEELTLSDVLDFIGSAAQGDILYRDAAAWARLAAGTAGNFLKTQGAGANPIWATAPGAGTSPVGTAGGRLTLVTATPVMTSTQSAKTTVFYTPYLSQFVPLYDGSTMTMTDVLGELSQTTSDTTKSPAAVAASSNYDVFVWTDSGTFRATRGPAWSSDTTRGTGAGTTELVQVKGVYLNANNITNGPAAQRGTYVGSIRSNGSSQIDWIFGASAAGGTAGVLGVWNNYNRVHVATQVTDTTSAYSYTTATVRQADASTGMQVSYIYGLNEDNADATYSANVVGISNTNGVQTGVGVDSTTAYSGATAHGGPSNATPVFPMVSHYSGYPGLGLHKLTALEKGLSAAVFNTTTNMTTGLIVNLRM